MYKIFETEKFIRSLEQDFGGQRAKITKKLHQFVYPQLKKFLDTALISRNFAIEIHLLGDIV